MSFIKIYIHAVWATKDRNPYLNTPIKKKVIEHIKEYAKEKNIFIDHINGDVEHIHCLISMNADQNIATIINLLKGESSHWINKQMLTESKFGWQDEYFAVSVGQSQIEDIRRYIRNQEEHHKKKTFQQEYEEFMKNYHFE
ncbi:MAG: IS200/IS605 family transposase [Bacteroidales bacterium]|nr:IS200/IS605 family transposase [Bacteroidales bacterium]